MKSKELCTALLDKIEDFKTNEEFNEHVYMSLVNNLQKVYDSIEDTEFIQIYYTNSEHDFEREDNHITVKNMCRTLKVVSSDLYRSINTRSLYTVLSSGVAIHRDLLTRIRSDLVDPKENYVYSDWVEDVHSMTVYRVSEP